MKLKHFDLENDIDFSNSHFFNVVCEDGHFSYKLIKEFYDMSLGGKGEFSLLENGKSLDIMKNVKVFVNLFDLNFDTKQINSLILKEMLEEVKDCEYQKDFEEIRTKTNNYLKNLIHNLDIPLSFKEFDEEVLIKNVEMSINTEGQTLIEKIFEYIEILLKLTKYKIFAFLNLKDFLSEKDCMYLKKFAEYNEIFILFFETRHTYTNAEEKTLYIDEDKCEFIDSN